MQACKYPTEKGFSIYASAPNSNPSIFDWIFVLAVGQRVGSGERARFVRPVSLYHAYDFLRIHLDVRQEEDSELIISKKANQGAIELSGKELQKIESLKKKIIASVEWSLPTCRAVPLLEHGGR